jgi:hypothetical protein
MTVDYGVMPIEAVLTLRVMTRGVTPLTGKEALGKRRTQNGSAVRTRWTLSRIAVLNITVYCVLCLTGDITMQFRDGRRRLLKFRAV